jgi:flagellar biosynthesis protein FlhF
METKTYFAVNLHSAMEVARRELGPDAMLVTSRPTPDNARAFDRLEVTFAYQTAPYETAAYQTAAYQTAAYETAAYETAAYAMPEVTSLVPKGAGNGRREPTGFDEIRREMAALRMAIGQSGGARGRVPGGGSGGLLTAGPEVVPEPYNAAPRLLCETGMEHDMALEIAKAGPATPRDGQGVLRELMARIPVAPFTPMAPEETRMLAFIGPPGRGKTTSLVKVAAQYGLGRRIPVRIFSAGAHGVGGAEQMARYASILGVPFQSFESFESLHLVLSGERWRGLVLIDTPGGIASDCGEMEGLARVFSRRKEIERHLVIRAEARSADMQHVLKKFTALEPTRLLITGVDEARGLGAAAETMIRSGIAATFFGTGARIPDDFEEVNAEKLARSLWSVNGLAARAA